MWLPTNSSFVPVVSSQLDGEPSESEDGSAVSLAGSDGSFAGAPTVGASVTRAPLYGRVHQAPILYKSYLNLPYLLEL